MASNGELGSPITRSLPPQGGTSGQPDGGNAPASKKPKTASSGGVVPTEPLSAETMLEMRSAWRSVCLLEVVSVEWRYLAPWGRMSQKSSSGSGFCLGGRRVLTNAHVVKSAIDIRVRQHGSARRFAAHVVSYGPDVDLAVLQIDESVADEFWLSATGAQAEELQLASELPALQEVLSVCRRRRLASSTRASLTRASSPWPHVTDVVFGSCRHHIAGVVSRRHRRRLVSSSLSLAASPSPSPASFPPDTGRRRRTNRVTSRGW